MTAGCDSVIYDDQGDCSVHYKVAFSYTKNMLNADAFSSQVSSVTLYVVDKDGNIVTSKSDEGTILAAPGYAMDVDVQPGIYDLLVWAEGTSPIEDPTQFVIASGYTPTSITELSASLNVLDGDKGKYSDKDITPLYYGLLRDVEFPDTYGDVIIGPVDLTKDTNEIQVMLQTIDGTMIEAGDFTFSITADNSELDYLNIPSSSNSVTYYPWNVAQIEVTFENENDDSRAGGITRDNGGNGLLAELSIGRLMADRRPTLTIIRNSDNVVVMSIDLVKYFLMVKGEYNRPLSDQDYLDRCSDYSLIFFLDNQHSWYVSAGIYINGWRIVPPQQNEI